MTGKNRTLGHCIFVMTLTVIMALLIACDNGSDSPGAPNTPDGTGETGSVSFTINWEEEPEESQSASTGEQTSETILKGAVDCIGRNLATIEVALFDSNNQEIIKKQWPCDEHGGTIDGIPAPQDGVTIVLFALNNDGKIAYRGEKGGLTINKGPGNDAGPIQAFRFIPAAGEPGGQPNSVQWNTIPGAADYRIVLSTAQDFSTTAHEGISQEPSYTPTGLAPSTLYYVRIYARDSWGNEGAVSANGSFTTIALEEIPQNVSAQGDLSKVTVNWEGDQGSRYNIYWSTTPDVPATYETNGGKIENHDSTSFDHVDLQGNTAYYYVVTSVNAAGYESDFSTEVTATAVGQPFGPENVTAMAGDRKATLNWTSVPGFVYNIYWATEPGVSKAESQKLAENLDADTFIHENLDSNTTYYYIVTAINALSESDPVGEVSAVPGWIELIASPEWEYAMDNAVDATGTNFVVGGTQAPFNDQHTNGENDILLAKQSPNGDVQWVKLIGTTENEWSHSMDVDPTGNSYIVGLTDGNWGADHTNPGRQIFLLKVDPDGNQVWIRFIPIDITRTYTNKVYIAVDSTGNSYISGTVPYKTDLGKDTFIAKYDSNGGDENGNPNWVQYLSSPENEDAADITLDDQGNIYVTGGTEGNLEGNTNAFVGREDVYVAKYAATDGALQWVTLAGSSFYDNGQTVAVKGDDCYVSGAWAGDLFVGKFSAADGSLQWSEVIEEAEQRYEESIFSDIAPNGNLIVGTDTRAANFDGQDNSGEPDDEGIYPYETLLLAYDTAGNRLWSKLYGSPESDAIHGLRVSADGYAHINGNTHGDFGGHQNAGSWDIFSWKRYVGP